MFENLPLEVVLDNIVPRIPIKSLLRCTSVCKSWYNLITNPNFISAHIDSISMVTHHGTDLLLLRRCCLTNPRLEQYTIHFDNDTFDEYAQIDFPFRSQIEYFRIVGSCNGVLCLSDDSICCSSDTIILWNPSIKKSVTLPSPMVRFRTPYGPFMHALGFGFDRVANDYKVVRVVYVNDCYCDLPQVEVYSLSSGCWRNGKGSGPQFVIHEREPQAYLNETAHWVAQNPTQDLIFSSSLIVVFCFSDETFGEIMLPETLAADWVTSMNVAVFGKSLCAVHQILSGNKDNYHIWVMKEYGVVESWTKLYNIDRQCNNDLVLFEMVVGFNKKGEALLAETGGNLVSYDPNSQQVSSLGIQAGMNCGIRGGRHLFYLDTYRESLILLGGVHGACKKKLFNGVVTCKALLTLSTEEDGTNSIKKLKRKSKRKRKNLRRTLSIGRAGLWLGWGLKKKKKKH